MPGCSGEVIPSLSHHILNSTYSNPHIPFIVPQNISSIVCLFVLFTFSIGEVWFQHGKEANSSCSSSVGRLQVNKYPLLCHLHRSFQPSTSQKITVSSISGNHTGITLVCPPDLSLLSGSITQSSPNLQSFPRGKVYWGLIKTCSSGDAGNLMSIAGSSIWALHNTDESPLHSFLISHIFLSLSSRFSLSIMFSRGFLVAIGIAFTFNAIGSSAYRHLYNTTQILETQTLSSPYPYEFPVLQNGSNADVGQFPMPKCNGFTLEEATIDQMQEALSKGTLTSVQIVMCYLQRIFQVDEYIRYVNCCSPMAKLICLGRSWNLIPISSKSQLRLTRNERMVMFAARFTESHFW